MNSFTQEISYLFQFILIPFIFRLILLICLFMKLPIHHYGHLTLQLHIFSLQSHFYKSRCFFPLILHSASLLYSAFTIYYFAWPTLIIWCLSLLCYILPDSLLKLHSITLTLISQSPSKISPWLPSYKLLIFLPTC